MTPAKEAQVCKGTRHADDVKFVDAMVRTIRDNFNIDDSRIYAAGFSNGCGFSMQRMLPERAHLFAAIGCVGSVVGEPFTVKGKRRPLMLLLGENDNRFTPTAGGPLPMNMLRFKANDFVQMVVTALTTSLGLTREHSFPLNGSGKVLLARYTQVRRPKHGQSLRLGIMKGVGHVYPNGKASHNGLIATDYLWKFFSRHTK